MLSRYAPTHFVTCMRTALLAPVRHLRTTPPSYRKFVFKIEAVDESISNTYQNKTLQYFKSRAQLRHIKEDLATPVDVYTLSVLGGFNGSTNIQQYLKQLSTDHLMSFVSTLHESDYNICTRDIDLLIRRLDEESCSRIRSIESTAEILKLLDAWMCILPNRMMHLHCYTLAMQKARKCLEEDKFSVPDLVHYMFYVGLQKKSVYSRQLMKHCLSCLYNNVNVKTLSLDDLCIIVNAAFKTGTKVTSPDVLQIVANVIKTDILKLVSKPHYLVTLIKCIRHSMFEDHLMLHTVATAGLANQDLIKNLSFAGKAHLLALYANCFYSSSFVEFLIKFCLADLKEMFPTKSLLKKNFSLNHPRAKDITTFLWATSFLGCCIDSSHLEHVIAPQIAHRLAHNEYKKNPEYIISTLLSLWMLDFKSKEIFDAVMTPDTIKALKAKGKFRYMSRLLLLLTCIKIEAPHFLDNDPTLQELGSTASETATGLNLTRRPYLARVYKALQCLGSKIGIVSISCDFCIPHLSIAGVTVHTVYGSFHIEVTDSFVCLCNTETPHGLMKLKLRLLESMGKMVLTISQSTLEGLNESDLFMFLEDEVKKTVKML